MREGEHGRGVGAHRHDLRRYYAMDRDKRWERVEAAYRMLVDGVAPFSARSAQAGLDAAYARGENDEFVQATTIADAGRAPARMEDGDVVVFMNFRADRARQMTRALTDPAFDAFPRARLPKLARFVCLSSYGDEFARLPVAFGPQTITNSFGELRRRARPHAAAYRRDREVRARHLLLQRRHRGRLPGRGPHHGAVAEGRDLRPPAGDERAEVTDKLVAAIGSGKYDAIICNYANGDMVGHTGVLEAAVKAVETLDAAIGRVVEATRKAGGEVLITADHGNAEMMHDPATGQPHTAHTLNVVRSCTSAPARLAAGGELKDVAPTMLALMGLPQPAEMTGRSLVALTN